MQKELILTYSYNPENIFAKILKGELPCKVVLETEHSLAFEDIAPIAPHHVLVIPKGSYVCWDHFSSEASDEKIIDFVRLIGRVCENNDLTGPSGGKGYRLISNAGEDASQEVPHLHVHILGGRLLGRMLPRFD